MSVVYFAPLVFQVTRKEYDQEGGRYHGGDRDGSEPPVDGGNHHHSEQDGDENLDVGVEHRLPKPLKPGNVGRGARDQLAGVDAVVETEGVALQRAIDRRADVRLNRLRKFGAKGS